MMAIAAIAPVTKSVIVRPPVFVASALVPASFEAVVEVGSFVDEFSFGNFTGDISKNLFCC